VGQGPGRRSRTAREKRRTMERRSTLADS
jgi:hypothetical protein